MAFAERLGERGLFYGFHLLAPFPGTAIGDDPESFGLQVLSRHWPDYHANRAICLPHGLDPDGLNAIAEGWQARFLDYLADIQARMQTGGASEEEAAQVHNMNRTAILYEMMMSETLEKLDMAGEIDAPPDESSSTLKDLARRAGRRLANWPEDTIRDALHHAQNRGGLRREITPEGRTAWRWVDQLPAASGNRRDEDAA